MTPACADAAVRAAAHFSASPAELTVEEIGSGNINDTFLVRSSGQAPFILQRISRQAFSRPEQICANLQVISRHLPPRTVAALVPTRRWVVPQLLTSREQGLWWCDASDNFWRAQSYVADAVTLAGLTSLEQAQEVGRALAIFHSLVAAIPPTALQAAIPHFHQTPHYFKLYQQACQADNQPEASELTDQCHHFIHHRAHQLSTLEDAKQRGELTETVIHGDPKLANILFDSKTHQACALIDLDTVGPGLRLYDLGDCLRSCCNRSGPGQGPESTRFDLDFCRAILTGYLEQSRPLLGAADHRYLYDAIRLIPLELGLRFFSDYLTGCHYFKTSDPQHTLRRALAQFHLVASIEAQHKELVDLLEDVAG
ncbi:MAG: aminoglycoside phosphotransferase family protein [Desulfurivibrionaceae bacterium]|nr:aminoglycoside phosphotransferase family protein [Desulfurivibrionaceae bacterium]